MNRRKKISVIGSGFTGATTALYLAQKELGDIVLVDMPQQENATKGKALDMQETAPIQSFDAWINGTSDYQDIQGSDIVVITAGIARKPGMSREDLVSTNANVMKAVTKEIVTHAPESIIIVLTNPVDAMTYTVFQASGFPKERVIGQSGVLDTARFRTFVAMELNVSVKDISGFVLGGHGDDMVPLLRYSYAGGIPLEKLLTPERLAAIVERTRKGGGEIVQLLGNGSAYYAPAAAIVEMVEAILKDQRRILPAIAYLEGEYGYEDLYLGVPTILGGNGVEQVLELDLTSEEKQGLDRSVSTVRSVLEML
ncbi:malate dehydrogenase, NAD-dependent [Exiguobacterium sibiricum 255-15]|uniref:Malate dehydrogenase n=1 Tax=Exiguobacterium sibiricum (strain DSM 17290 / CCUG 55495 / CIP 109462 / JCM 13490 / 255-15) TaxID=262543 RepID=B1YKA6_EXIS2|nr:malate dehydrogenase [Exiguobacterium sibiricum]ACB61659.1 malate dehydrogenase, NAD-dependent [Exiguobacterium sibiricum 255-15]